MGRPAVPAGSPSSELRYSLPITYAQQLCDASFKLVFWMSCMASDGADTGHAVVMNLDFFTSKDMVTGCSSVVYLHWVGECSVSPKVCNAKQPEQALTPRCRTWRQTMLQLSPYHATASHERSGLAGAEQLGPCSMRPSRPACFRRLRRAPGFTMTTALARISLWDTLHMFTHLS